MWGFWAEPQMPNPISGTTMVGMIHSSWGFSTRLRRFFSRTSTSMIGMIASGISFSGATSCLSPKTFCDLPPRPTRSP